MYGTIKRSFFIYEVEYTNAMKSNYAKSFSLTLSLVLDSNGRTTEARFIYP